MGTTIRNDALFCDKCGMKLKVNLPLGIEKFVELIEKFDKEHKDCEQTWKVPVPEPAMNEKQRANWWWLNGHKGMSSISIWMYFMGEHEDNPKFPYDPADFHRCHKLFQLMPEWRKRIKELRYLGDVWERYSENWDQLEMMFNENEKTQWSKCDEIGMYEFMEKLWRKH